LLAAEDPSNQDWPAYGGGLGAQHFSTRTQIDKSNVAQLKVAWTFHTGALQIPGATNQRSSFEANPVLWNKAIYFDTPYDEVFALDALTGKKLWSMDPKVSHSAPFDIVASRGVALWHGSQRGVGVCGSDRVFVATLDHRLIAMDARDGTLCGDFGRSGVVDLADGLHLTDTRWFSFTSPPTVVGDVVAIGSSIGDNQLVEAPSGVIRGFDARSGEVIWSFEPLPWAQTAKQRSGSGGAWSVLSADPQLGLLFVPTGSPSVDFYGVNRPGDNRDANSVVALDVKTGRKVWAFQVVHHDLWDYDVAAEPLLFTFHGSIPAIAVTTKMGMTFVLDRRTGAPLYPVEERPVPRSDIEGEATSATQPFSSLPLMAPMTIDPSQIRGRDAAETKACREKIASLVNKGPYTPVGLTATLLYPGSIGGVNWGSAAIDPNTAKLYANVNRLAYEVRLVPRNEDAHVSVKSVLQDAWDFWRDLFAPSPPSSPVESTRYQPPDAGGSELSAQAGTPYKIFRAPILSRTGIPCTPGPWGALVALDLNNGTKLWTAALGTLLPGQISGAATVGGPIVTASGLIFTGGGTEPLLRAFDSSTGQELWQGELPAAAQSTPMSYEINGRQFVVVSAGGHGSLAQHLSDSVVAFALHSTD
jgi:quinoprotein glucose dehydrogenase